MHGHHPTSRFVPHGLAHPSLATLASLPFPGRPRKAHGWDSRGMWFLMSGIIFLSISACLALSCSPSLCSNVILSVKAFLTALFKTLPISLLCSIVPRRCTSHLCHMGNSFIAMPDWKSTTRQLSQKDSQDDWITWFIKSIKTHTRRIMGVS